MKKRFEIPINPDDITSKVNLFAVDDYLRSIGSTQARQKLIREVGTSPKKRAAYEKKMGLPRGAVEMALFMEDKRIQKLNRMIQEKLPMIYDRKSDPKFLEDFYRESYTVSMGLRQLYPEATDFMMEYALVSQRNRRQFLGDYTFSNEYKLQLASCFLMCDGGLNCNANINISVNVNVGLHVNLAAVQKVALALIAWVAIAVCVFVAAKPGLYGLPFQFADEGLDKRH